jgi:RNA polymerase sigma-70 factor (ECF subfamily)
VSCAVEGVWGWGVVSASAPSPAAWLLRMSKEVSARPGAPISAAAALASGARGASGATGPAAEVGSTDVGAPPLDFERVYTQCFHPVCRWARALGGLDADLDDLAQEVFLVVRRKLDTFHGPSLHAWLYGITRKTVSDYRRRAWMRRLLAGGRRTLDAEREAAPRAALGSVERWEAQRTLQSVLSQMSTVRRSAFVLFEVEGYSGDEIAELEQIPLATVYTRLHHARKDFLRLTAELTGLPEEEPPP